MGKGIRVGILLHFFQLAIITAMFMVAASLPGKQGETWGYSAIVIPFAIGLTQIIYMVPAILIYRSKQQYPVAKGITIVAAVTFLLNASCFGLLWLGSRK